MGCRGEERTKGGKEFTLTIKFIAKNPSKATDRDIADAIVGGGISREQFVELGEQITDIILLRLVKAGIRATPDLRAITLGDKRMVLAKVDHDEGEVV